MSTPIYLNSGMDDLAKFLLQQAATKQQNEIHKEQLANQKKQLELDAMKYQQDKAKEEQARNDQMAPVIKALFDALHDPNPQIQQMAAPVVRNWGDATAPSGQVESQALAVAGPQVMGNKVGPSLIEQARQNIQKKELRATLAKSLSPDELKQYEMGNLVYQQALAASGGDDEYARKMAGSYVPPTVKESAEIAEINQRVRLAASKQEGGILAADHLKTKYNIDLPPEIAAQTLADLEKNAITFRQNRELTAMREQGANTRQLMARQDGILRQLSDRFQRNPVVKSAETAATGYAKIKELGVKLAKGEKFTGHDDVLLIDAMTRLATGTVVREQQVKLIRGSSSLAEKIGTFTANLYTPGGRRLSDEQRRNIVAAADAMIEPYKRQYADVTKPFVEQAKMNGIDPTLIITDPFTAIPEQFRESPSEKRERLRQGGKK